MSERFIKKLRNDAPYLNVQKTNTGANIQMKINSRNATWASVNNKGNTLIIQGILTNDNFKRRGLATILQQIIRNAARKSGYNRIEGVAVRTSAKNNMPASSGVFKKSGFHQMNVVKSPSGKIKSVRWFHNLKV
jgi:hypothetical protein